MSNIPNLPMGSHRPLLLEVVFLTKGGKQSLPLQRDFIESIDITMKRSAAWTGTLVLFDRTGDTIFDLVTAAGNDRKIIIRWGWDDGRGLEQYPQYISHYTMMTPEFTAQGVRITFDLLAQPAYEQATDKRTRSFEAGTLISDIVTQIAQDRGWSTVDARGSLTIEPTISKLTEPLVQRGESDMVFILRHVQPRAINATKAGNYRFWFDNDNTVRFHTDEYAPKGNIPKVVKYRFAQDQMGEVISFTPVDHKFFTAIKGEAASVFWGIDSLNGTRIRLASTDIGGLPDSEPTVDAEGTHITRFIPKSVADAGTAVVNFFKGMVARTEVDFEAKVRKRYDDLRRRAYQAGLEVLGTHGAIPQDRIEVEYLSHASQLPHFLSGTFFVSEVSHSISSGGWQTSMELYRLGNPKTDDAEEVIASVKQTAQTTPQTQGGGRENPKSRSGQASKERRTVG